MVFHSRQTCKRHSVGVCIFVFVGARQWVSGSLLLKNWWKRNREKFKRVSAISLKDVSTISLKKGSIISSKSGSAISFKSVSAILPKKGPPGFISWAVRHMLFVLQLFKANDAMCQKGDRTFVQKGDSLLYLKVGPWLGRKVGPRIVRKVCPPFVRKLGPRLRPKCVPQQSASN